MCINTALTNITHTTTGATGIGTTTGLPSGVSAVWSSNTITISGTPTASGTFNYSIPLTGGCGSVSATGTITVYTTFSAGAINSTGETICYNGNPSLAIGSLINASGGDNVIMYKWQANGMDIPNADVATYDPSPGLLVTTTFTRFAKDNTCNTTFILSSGSWVITVTPESNGGTVTGGTSICAGSNSGTLTLSSYIGTIVRWESSVNPFNVWTSISNTIDTFTSGVLTETTQFRAVVQNGVCPEAFSTPTTATIATTTWTSFGGGSWDNGTPNSTKAAIIATTFTSAGGGVGSFSACSLTVNSGVTVVISSGDSVTLSGSLTAIPGSFVTFNNNANLIQTSNVANPHPIIIKRNSSPLYRLDYTLWSSPVANQQLKAFSPATLDTRFYSYNTEAITLPVPIAANIYVAITSPSTTNFETGKGYLIRMPNTWPAYVNNTIPGTNWTGFFTGVPNNGDYNFTLLSGSVGQRFNLVGNPYPSPINATDFINNPTNDANTTGTLYFWRKTNNSNNLSYSSWNQGVGYLNPNGEAPESTIFLNKVINVGQGFFVEGSGSGTSLVFNNAMRIDNHDNQFFKSANTLNTTLIERNRIWLKASNSSGLTTKPY